MRPFFKMYPKFKGKCNPKIFFLPKAAESKNEIYIYSVFFKQFSILNITKQEYSRLNSIQTIINISPPLSQLNFRVASGR